ncbi:MAG: hypothetical protein ACRDTC_06155 [Pseudonocardiaceae bacterium]
MGRDKDKDDDKSGNKGKGDDSGGKHGKEDSTRDAHRNRPIPDRAEPNKHDR